VYRVHKFLWELRRNPALAERFKEDPRGTLASYGISEDEGRGLLAWDFKKFYESGANPYILYFGALQMGVSRAEYYERLRGESTGQPVRR